MKMRWSFLRETTKYLATNEVGSELKTGRQNFQFPPKLYKNTVQSAADPLFGGICL